MNAPAGIDIYEFYQKVLVPLTPPFAVSHIIEIIMSGGETNEEFAQVLAQDSELQYWVRLTVRRLGFERRNHKLEQMILLLGQNRIRDLIIGRAIERKFIKPEETLLGLHHAQKEKDASEKKETKVEDTEAVKDADVAAAEAEAREIESIPEIALFQQYLEFANRAEEIAITIRNSYPGQAFAGGVTFDYIRHYFKSVKWGNLTDSRLKKPEDYLEEIFIDGLRCAIAANEITQKISISHQRTVFVTALLHNIGKALLFAYDPQNFEKTFLASTGADKNRRIDSVEAETEIFDLDHAQAGSLFIGRLPYLAEIERSVDYSHNPHLLRFQNPKLYALAALLRVSGALAKLYQKSRKESSDTDRIGDNKLVASEDFKFLKLSLDDWAEIKSDYALKLMKVKL